MISLDGDRVSATLLVWMSAKAKAKKEPKVPKPAEAWSQQVEVEGTMDAARFREWWFGPVSELCKVVQDANSIHEIYEHLRDSTSALAKNYTTDDLKQDAAVLAHYIGRKPVHVMDGASYHKLTDPCYVPLHGQGGLYGLRGNEEKLHRLVRPRRRCTQGDPGKPGPS